MKSKTKSLMALGLLAWAGWASLSWADMEPTPVVYQPTSVQAKSAVALTRTQITKGLLESKTAAAQMTPDAQASLTEKQMKANKTLFEIEQFQGKLSEAY